MVSVKIRFSSLSALLEPRYGFGIKSLRGGGGGEV